MTSAKMPNVTSFSSIVPVAGPAALNWPSNNLAIFVPLRLTEATTLKRFFYLSGNNTGNVDVGIYDEAGNKIISTGSTAQSTSNQVNYISVASTALATGNYFLAIAYASTTAAPFRAGGQQMTRAMGILQMASALPLPTTATFAAAGQDYIPLFGFSTLTAAL